MKKLFFIILVILGVFFLNHILTKPASSPLHEEIIINNTDPKPPEDKEKIQIEKKDLTASEVPKDKQSNTNQTVNEKSKHNERNDERSNEKQNINKNNSPVHINKINLKNIIEQKEDELFSDTWNCCALNHDFIDKDFRFSSGNISFSTFDRFLVNGTDSRGLSFTSFKMTLLEKDNYITPTHIVNMNTSPGIIKISKNHQDRLREPLSSQIINIPVINQTAFYFKGFLANKYPQKVSHIEDNPDPSDVISLCAEFKIVPALGLSKRVKGKEWKELIGILYCKLNTNHYEKLALVTIKKI